MSDSLNDAYGMLNETLTLGPFFAPFDCGFALDFGLPSVFADLARVSLASKAELESGALRFVPVCKASEMSPPKCL